ncbi:MAG: hypothetical protein JSS14_22005 [Proteobacteria bacterium]|nr:hypothetical protein [Pseudomonadota bacterium]
MPKLTIRKRVSAIQIERITLFTDLTIDELHEVEYTLAAPDPYAVLRAKTVAVAELLGCDEGEAERIIFERAGHY